MNYSKILITLCVGVVIATTGCAPKLASKPLNPQQQYWHDTLKKYYPDWEPPYISPLQVSDNYVVEEKKTIRSLEDIKPLPGPEKRIYIQDEDINIKPQADASPVVEPEVHVEPAAAAPEKVQEEMGTEPDIKLVSPGK